MIMEYQKTINLLDNTQINHLNWVEINDDARGMYNTNSKIKFKLQSWSQVYVAIVISTYLWVEL